MIPKRVTLENFLSFGPKTEIAFTDDEHLLLVLGGPNGVGKSAVFDAITFCLFGAHRGGAREIDPLIRHGTNGFSVSFEFEFDKVDYRIARSRMGNRATQAVEQRRTDGGWTRVPNINAIGDVRAWTERTLGLGFEAFKASVLLRQGEADAIIMAKGTERLTILKKIIGVEPFEDLSKRVHEASRGKAGERDRAVQRRERSEEVRETDLVAAKEVVGAAEADRADAEAARASATERIALAKQWSFLAERHQQLTDRIRAADERAVEADHIRRGKERLDELTALLPIASKLVPLRDATGDAERRVTTAKEDLAKAVAEKDELAERCEELRRKISDHQNAAKQFTTKDEEGRSALARQERFLTLAESVDDIEKHLREFDRKYEKLDEQVKGVEKKHTAAVAEERNALQQKTEAATLLGQAERERKQIEAVEVGVKCSRCGQLVTANHAAAERKRLADRIAELKTREKTAARQAEEAIQALRAVEAEKKTLGQALADRTALRQRFEDQRKTLTDLGLTSDLAHLRSEVDRLKKEVGELEQKQRQEARALKASEEEQKKTQTALDKKIAEGHRLIGEAEKLEKEVIADAATVKTLTGQLPEAWRAVTCEQVDSRDKELAGLKASRIGDRFQQLVEDEARRDEWGKQLRDTEAERAAIPESARIRLAEAEGLDASAREAFDEADRRLQEARDSLTDLCRKADQHERIKQEVEEAEREARIHEKLDALLGRNGLQRELVRDAETQIVRLANETIHRLDGDLSIELDQSNESGDEAFALQVRAADDPTPTDVTYLSGSQKFRVAVSVALAIGRFASGQARPLECVIIDEGFGSLDKDGLKAAAEELNRLKQYMRRIILVSHQEDFTDHFPVVIRLSKGERNSGGGGEAVTSRRH